MSAGKVIENGHVMNGKSHNKEGENQFDIHNGTNSLKASLNGVKNGSPTPLHKENGTTISADLASVANHENL